MVLDIKNLLLTIRQKLITPKTSKICYVFYFVADPLKSRQNDESTAATKKKTHFII